MTITLPLPFNNTDTILPPPPHGARVAQCDHLFFIMAPFPTVGTLQPCGGTGALWSQNRNQN